ncbi:Synaptotagmin-17 [Toxocara canis]|uniref:Synaptotagmin-17 n=1 Tax=Toxocara canis TaxID=6265 RepID=A0A0B2UVA6_TOXCA|nr:Synaptotagmin-17 [Toxocara canis]
MFDVRSLMITTHYGFPAPVFLNVVYKFVTQLRSRIFTRGHLIFQFLQRSKNNVSMNDVQLVPVARIGLEYNEKESLLSVYIKCFQNLRPVVGPWHMECLARVIVVKRVRRSWLQSRRAAVINIEEVDASGRIDMETLAVRRQSTTIFNQWYCCELPQQLFHTCALKIQFCHLNRYSQKTVVAEADYWIDENPIEKFTEYDIPLRMAKPDLGEVEVGLCYLPTSERLCVTIVQATNLRLQSDSFASTSKTLVKVHLLYANQTRDRRRTQLVEGTDPQFNQLHTFDVSKNELDGTLLVITVVEVSESWKSEIGRIVLAHSVQSAEHTHWRRMLKEPRTKHTEVHKLSPC